MIVSSAITTDGRLVAHSSGGPIREPTAPPAVAERENSDTRITTNINQRKSRRDRLIVIPLGRFTRIAALRLSLRAKERNENPTARGLPTRLSPGTLCQDYASKTTNQLIPSTEKTRGTLDRSQRGSSVRDKLARRPGNALRGSDIHPFRPPRNTLPANKRQSNLIPVPWSAEISQHLHKILCIRDSFTRSMQESLRPLFR